MTYALYVTHPQVVQDPQLPVPRWGLSPTGRARAERFARHPLVRAARRIVASRETKALDLAEALAAVSGAPVEPEEAFGENDRSSTGFVPADRFDQLADAFFAQPEESAAGWERAVDAQARIAAAFEAALAGHDPELPVLFAGHGAVGTLLKCRLGGRAIARSEDQRRLADPGGGNVFVVRLRDRALLGDWTPMEQLPEQLAP
ncbi:MAG: histidine phosphatase family protein [Devosia sp.]